MGKPWYTGLLLAVLVWSNEALAYCWEEVAARYDIEAELLQAIAEVESGYRAKNRVAVVIRSLKTVIHTSASDY
jgi:hypothetical protein